MTVTARLVIGQRKRAATPAAEFQVVPGDAVKLERAEGVIEKFLPAAALAHCKVEQHAVTPPPPKTQFESSKHSHHSPAVRRAVTTCLSVGTEYRSATWKR